MDHRDSLQRDVYHLDAEPTASERELISAGKELIFRGLQAAVDSGIDRAVTGVLVDEQYGSAVARSARAGGFDLAMPIERSGEELFVLEYGSLDTGEWLAHIDEFSPDQVKVLVRDNPGDDAAGRERQLNDLVVVSKALAERGLVFLIELVVPTTDGQLASVNGDKLRYDTEIRPALTGRIMKDMQTAGIEPAFWKIEGLETEAAAKDLVEIAREGGRDEIRLIVLGRDAPADRLDHWLTIAARSGGFSGFAIGRSIWEQPLIDQLAGKIADEELIAQVAENYTHFVRTYEGALT